MVRSVQAEHAQPLPSSLTDGYVTRSLWGQKGRVRVVEMGSQPLFRTTGVSCLILRESVRCGTGGGATQERPGTFQEAQKGSERSWNGNRTGTEIVRRVYRVMGRKTERLGSWHLAWPLPSAHSTGTGGEGQDSLAGVSACTPLHHAVGHIQEHLGRLTGLGREQQPTRGQEHSQGHSSGESQGPAPDL
jgi:hypothetical protein